MKEDKTQKKVRVNFRPVLFCALGLAMGVFFYTRIRFGGLVPSDFLFIALFVLFALVPLGKKRSLCVFLCLALSAGMGVLSVHLYTARFLSAAEAEGRLSGTVSSATVRQGYSLLTLDGLSVNGEAVGGKCRVFYNGEDVRTGDMIVCDATLTPVGLEALDDDPYARGDFSKDIRYMASVSSLEKTGRSNNLFLRMNAALYDCLHGNMERDRADLGFALLTGNAGGVDGDISEAVQRGGVAHIFAVSGLHIGILYAAVYACFPFLKKSRVLPPILAAFFYCGLCNFTASSVRALIMCGTLGVMRTFGKKYDFLESVSLAALFTLLFFPQQWLSAGMRLTYSAALGIALLRPPLRTLLLRIRCPRFLAEYFSTALGVQLFALPVLLDAFGYVPVYSLLLNFFLIPALPVLFLGTLLCALFALVIPPAAPFFLLFPEGMFSAFLYVFSVADVSFVLAGFSLGAGSAILLTGCVALSGRVRLSVLEKSVAAAALAVLFTVAVVLQNVVFSGVRLEFYSREGNTLALARSPHESVLFLDGDVTVSDCKDFLGRTYGGKLTAVVVLSEDEVAGANTAAFLPAERVILRDPCETGLREVPLAFGTQFSVGEMEFRFESRSKLLLFAEGCAVELDFEGNEAFGADLFLGESSPVKRLNYFLKNGIIRSL